MQGIDGRWHDEPPLVIRTPMVPPAAESTFTAADSEELRFTLKELFLATTIAAVLLALFRSLGIFGAVLSFLTAAILTFVLPQLMPRNCPRQRTLFDFIWGIVMPIVCLVFDPMVFKFGDLDEPFGMFGYQAPGMGGGNVQINKAAYFAWPLLGTQILIMAMVLVCGKSLRRIGPILAGSLGVGFIVAACLAFLLIFPAMAGTLLLGIGMLGFTPIFTSITYFRRMRVMWLLARGDRSIELQLVLAALGILLPLILAGSIGFTALRW